MGPVRQNPIQRIVRTAHLSVLMTAHNFQYWRPEADATGIMQSSDRDTDSKGYGLVWQQYSTIYP